MPRPASNPIAALAFTLLSAVLPALSLEPTTPLAHLNRQSWVMENGLPQNTIQAIAQTTDGFLWLGTETGIVRFDGVQFALFDRNSRPALPGNDIRCLRAMPDGALLVDTSDGTALLNRDHTTPTTETCAVDQLHTRSGAGWSATATRSSVTITATGKPPLRLEAGKQLPGTRIQTLLADREGSLWIGTNRGLARWTAGKLDLLPITDPLARASVLNLLEDREGNLWIGTETSGLHLLRDQRFLNMGTGEGLSDDAITAVTGDSAGKLWVGTNGGGLNAVRLAISQPGQAPAYAVHFGLLSEVILSLATGPGNELWIGTPDGLNRIRGSAIDAFTSADGLPDDFIRSLLVDKDGSLWIGTRHGLAHWNFDADGRSVTHRAIFTTADGLGSNVVGAVVRDSQGDFWIATLSGLSRLHAEKITNYTTANGLSSNVITSLLARPNGQLLIGTEDHGWNLWDGSQFHPIAHAGAETAAIHAILDDHLGHLWLTTGTGIARCDAAGLDTQTCPNWIEFTTADGLRSRETATNGHPSAWRAADGHLWFATPKGLVTVDPAHFPVNTVPPPVAMERFAIDDADQPLPGDAIPLRVSSGHVHFQFDYAALSFIAPQKVRYRYMLEGFDRNWTEAGSRRTAYYTNIPPGKYTFRVQAANNDGLWNIAGASLAFELRPHFYQTVWFYVALAAALILLVILVLRLRLRRAEREFRAVLAERSRIAREIHDTLAQGYVGVSVQLEVLSELLRRNRLDAAQKHLDTTRESVRAGLADARQSIWALRSQDAAETTLPVRLNRITEQAASSSLNARFAIYGAYRPLPAAIEQEILRIAQEAIHNTVRHAHASHLWVQLEYRPAEIVLEVRDDGHGFTPSSRITSPPGHYGLIGMRERAESIRAALELTSNPSEGTAIRLTIPTETNSPPPHQSEG